MDFLNENTAVLIGSLVIFGIIGFWFYQLHKKIKKSGLTLTEYINDVLLAQHMSFVLFVLVVLNISEAVYAASIPETEKYLNPVARFFAHGGIQLVSIIMMVSLPQQIAELIDDSKFIFSKSKKTRNDANRWMIWVSQLFIITLVAVTSISIPIINFYVIAAGLDERQVALWALQELAGYRLEESYIYYGLSKDYNPFLGEPHTGNMALSYPMWAGMVLVYVHLALGLLDGVVALKRKLKRPYEEGLGTTETASERVGSRTPTQRELEKIKRNPEEALEYLIQKVGGPRNTKNIDQKIEDYLDIFEDLDRREKNSISNKMGQLVASWQQLDEDESAKKFSERIIKRRDQELTKQTLEFFRKSPKAGGFGRPLSRRGTG